MVSTIVLILIALTFLVLLSGAVVMARGGHVSKKLSNRLMIARVVMQGLAIVALLVMVFISR